MRPGAFLFDGASMLIGQDICIVGAGIGGLAAACALAMRGARVTVLEQADAVREVGRRRPRPAAGPPGLTLVPPPKED